jgi:hypothetical protein
VAYERAGGLTEAVFEAFGRAKRIDVCCLRCQTQNSRSSFAGQGVAQRGTGELLVVLPFVLVVTQFSMEAALAELAIDDLTKDAEDDIDFVNDKGMCP